MNTKQKLLTVPIYDAKLAAQVKDFHQAEVDAHNAGGKRPPRPKLYESIARLLRTGLRSTSDSR